MIKVLLWCYPVINMMMMMIFVDTLIVKLLASVQ